MQPNLPTLRFDPPENWEVEAEMTGGVRAVLCAEGIMVEHANSWQFWPTQVLMPVPDITERIL